jgi:hypothetical protein
MWWFWQRGPSVPPSLTDPPDWMIEEVRRKTHKPIEECVRILTRPTLEEYWALTGDGPDESENRDPAESDVALAPYLLRASLEAELHVGPDGEEGHCFTIWDCKTRILRRQYGIRWRDPSTMNPDICFD